jgi:hypothetical protein
MSNQPISAAQAAKEIWAMFEKIADEQGLNGEERAKVLDQFSAAAFYEPTFKGTEA